ncbi:MAG: hypothetical protein AB8G23_04945 [Myxococcota bacterium]
MLKIGLFLGLVAAAAAFLVSCGQQTRKDALEQAAGAIGFRYLGDAGAAEEAGWRQLPSVAARKQAFFSHVMQGAEVWSFDWTWREGVLKEGKREKQTVVAHRVPGSNGAAFALTARGAISKGSSAKLGTPMSFPDEPGFGDRFDLAGPDHAALRERFSPAVREQLSLPPGLRVEGAGDWVVGFYPERELTPTEWADLVEAMKPIGAAFGQ